MLTKIFYYLTLLEWTAFKMLSSAFIFIITIGLFRLGLTFLFQFLNPIKEAKKRNKIFQKTLDLFYEAVSNITDADTRIKLLDENCKNLEAACVEGKEFPKCFKGGAHA